MIYILKKIFQLLLEKDAELRFRSLKRGVDEIIDTLGSEDDSERGSKYQPPESNNSYKAHN